MKTDEKSPSLADVPLMDEAEKLIWALLDEQIEEDDAKRLEILLKENEQVRSRYVQCAQIHASLYEHYRLGTPPEVDVPSPVLGSLSGFATFPVDPSSVPD